MSASRRSEGFFVLMNAGTHPNHSSLKKNTAELHSSLHAFGAQETQQNSQTTEST